MGKLCKETCSLCKRQEIDEEKSWGWEHFSFGYTFSFCPECDKNRRQECDKVIEECFAHYQKRHEESKSKA